MDSEDIGKILTKLHTISMTARHMKKDAKNTAPFDVIMWEANDIREIIEEEERE